MATQKRDKLFRIEYGHRAQSDDDFQPDDGKEVKIPPPPRNFVSAVMPPVIRESDAPSQKRER